MTLLHFQDLLINALLNIKEDLLFVSFNAVNMSQISYDMVSN